ncbi:MAG: hypothetical protein JSS38_17640 [Nitrospira sp.]|nr:hypothetical protein [Nitrospira sp.]
MAPAMDGDDQADVIKAGLLFTGVAGMERHGVLQKLKQTFHLLSLIESSLVIKFKYEKIGTA